MRIKLDEEYVIKPGHGNSYLLVKNLGIRERVNKNTGETREEYNDLMIADAEIPILIRRYATLRFSEEKQGCTIDLEQFVEEYRELVENITKQVNRSLETSLWACNEELEKEKRKKK